MDLAAGDNVSWELAQVVRERVQQVYPSIQSDMWKSITGETTELYFVPLSTSEVSVEIVISDQGEFSVCAGASTLEADQELVNERLEFVVRLVLAFAGHGYSKVTIPIFFGPWGGSHVGPTGGFQGLDDVLEHPLATVVEYLDPWSNPRSAESD